MDSKSDGHGIGRGPPGVRGNASIGGRGKRGRSPLGKSSQRNEQKSQTGHGGQRHWSYTGLKQHMDLLRIIENQTAQCITVFSLHDIMVLLLQA